MGRNDLKRLCKWAAWTWRKNASEEDVVRTSTLVVVCLCCAACGEEMCSMSEWPASGFRIVCSSLLLEVFSGNFVAIRVGCEQDDLLQPEYLASFVALNKEALQSLP
ncbi:hypothetical protein BDV19DRAFT_26013 [Aspergillus venezuelensis]